MKSLERLFSELLEVDDVSAGRLQRLRSEPRLVDDEVRVSALRDRIRLNPLQFSRGAMLDVVTFAPDVVVVPERMRLNFSRQ